MSIRFISVFLSFLFFLPAIGFSESDNRSHSVLVSVAPHQYFVEKIAGPTVKIILMVPAGASAHTYEPTPRQMLESSKADLWFFVGEGFENKIKKSFQSYNPRLQFIDMREGVNLIIFDENNHRCCHHHHDNYDLHYWLSPKEAKTQARTIANALMSVYPENKEMYQANLNSLEHELDVLDQQIRQILKTPHNPLIMVSHPAYAYYARDYGFRQLSIEIEGKDPTPQQLTNILREAKKNNIKTIFVQVQYSSKGAKLIASQIGAEVVDLNPYSADYANSLLQITKAFTAVKD